VQLNAAEQVELKLKTPWRDRTTHLVMSPLEFMQRLAALVPRPRLHLIRYHGVLAPNAKLRPLVVPQGPHAPEQANEAAVADPCEVETVQARPHRIGWARLLKRVFDIDMQHCPTCGDGEPNGRCRHRPRTGSPGHHLSAVKGSFLATRPFGVAPRAFTNRWPGRAPGRCSLLPVTFGAPRQRRD
jgi:hypothetical protein